MTPLVAATAALGAFVAMEGVSYALHRWVMHGVGWRWHRSHHDTRPHRREANDIFPAVVAAATITVFACSGGPSSVWFWLATGMTLYGLAYALVHDVYIHRRVAAPLPHLRVLDWLRTRHARHHASGGEPFGMLAPRRPERARVRRRTRSTRARL